ncbi:VOC family protein [Candidatus Harpocratesius sp.]
MQSFTILYVKDQISSTNYYIHVFEIEPVLNVPGMTEFIFPSNFRLGLMPNNGIMKLLKNQIPHPDEAVGIPRCELYIFNKHPTTILQRIEEFGGKIISPLKLRDWGDRVGYGMDLDGHILAIAEEKPL